jgi:hypothetical protein
MSKWILRAAALSVFLCIASVATADEPQPPKQEPESLPPPKMLVPEPLYVFPPRVQSRWVWSLYAPNSAGRMRPRVVLSPYGSYYLRDGEPFPWTTTQQQLLLPRTGD